MWPITIAFCLKQVINFAELHFIFAGFVVNDADNWVFLWQAKLIEAVNNILEIHLAL